VLKNQKKETNINNLPFKEQEGLSRKELKISNLNRRISLRPQLKIA